MITTLIVTSLLVLLVMALLSLSTVSQRQSVAGLAQEQARANAKLSLQVALGELQRMAGPDQRVTAPAPTLTAATDDNDARNPANLGLTGAWRSWENSDFIDTSKPPTTPDYTLKRSTGAAGGPATGGRFLGWLQSTSTLVNGKRVAQASSSHKADQPPPLAKSATSVPMLSAGTLGSLANTRNEVHIEPVDVVGTSGNGTLAWWVCGENTKAHVATPDVDRSNLPSKDQVFSYREAMATHGLPDLKSLDVTYKGSQAQDAPKLVTRDTLDLATTYSVPPSEKFYHLTTNGQGLLTNTSAGGWRKDISLASTYNFEGLSGWPPYNPVDKANAWIYPWATLRNPGESMWRQVGPVLSWKALADYVNQYKEIQSGLATGHVVFEPSCGSIGDTTYASQFLHNVNRMPVLADMRFVMAYSTKQAAGSTPAPIYEAHATINPVLTLWNPYNFEISLRDMRVSFNNLPLVYEWMINNVKYQTAFYTLIGRQPKSQGLVITIKDSVALGANTIRLAAGETRVYSPTSTNFVDGGNTQDITVTPGYRTRGGYRFPIKNGATGAIVTAPGTATFKVDKIFTADVNWGYGGGQEEIGETSGVYYDINATLRIDSQNVNLWTSAHRMQYDPATAAKYFKPLLGMPEIKMSDAEASNQVFASSALTFRTANDTQFPVRGMSQMIPTSLYTELGRKGGYDISHPDSGVYVGSQHPVNSPYELMYFAHSGWQDTKLPNVTSKNQGYTVTGIAANNGLSRCVLHELPLRPMLSLGELQHFQFRGQNSFAPYRANIAANSQAHPLVPSNNSEIPVPAGKYRMQFDDSYCINRMLFDDYFLSSVSEDPKEWGGGNSILRDIKKVYRDFLNYYLSTDSALRDISKPLPNLSYRPAPLTEKMDKSFQDAVEAAVTRHLDVSTGWNTLASRLRVEGMFNVNSTSVEAWKSLLAHARNMSVPYSQTTSNALGQSRTTVSLESGTGAPFPRGTVAGDKAGLADYPAFGGYSRLSDTQIDALAVAIVKQIRRRGPSLSLAEFVNRQLREQNDKDVDLALAGPIQAALNELATYNDARNPYQALQKLSRNITSSIVPSDAEYKFPMAAVGWSTEGMPGWITQADVLRAIAPVLSARDDTFIVRTCGESKTKAGKLQARIWCEAIVQRQADYLSPDSSLESADDANLSTGQNKEINSRFGRRFKVLSFRYLSPSEV